ncbi:MAG: winged helix-turn-helix domain-containing protein [Myxococcota bacterium]
MRLLLTDRELDLDAGVVRGPEPARLTPIEVRLLRHLATRLGHAVPQEALLESVWGYGENVQTRTVTVTVNRLRAKLEVDAAEPVHLLTHRGSGYALEARPVRDDALHPPHPGGVCVGREREVASALAALERGAGVVLHGGPGMGKTRVALELADRWPGPVAWIDLEGCTSMDDALGRVVQRLGTRRNPGEIAQAGLGLADRVDVVVLDGVEGLAAGIEPMCATWMRAGVAVVLTTRIAIPLDGADRIELGPLDAPAATALLRSRSGIGADEARSVVARCDGVPLALVLESGTALSLGPTGGAGLSGAFRRSWALLDAVHRDALAQCAAFGAGFGVDEAVAVLGGEALARLLVLRANGLLQREGARLRLLGCLRAEVAGIAPEAVHTGRLRHLAHFASLCRAWHAGLFASERAQVVDDVMEARAELEVALDTGVAHDPQAACEILRVFVYVLLLRVGESSAGWIERVAAVAPDTEAGLWAQALRAQVRRDVADVERVADRAEADGHLDLTGRQLTSLAQIAVLETRMDDAEGYARRGLALGLGPRWVSRCWLGLAKVARTRGHADLELEHLARARETADDSDPVHSWELEMSEGRAALERGSLGKARGHFVRALEVTQRESPLLTLSPIGNLARVETLLGDHAQAVVSFERQLALAEHFGNDHQRFIAIVRRAAAVVDLGRADADDVVADAVRALPEGVAADIRTFLAGVRVLRALETGADLDAALDYLDASEAPAGNDAEHRVWHAVAGWVRGIPVPSGLPAEIARAGHTDLAWDLLALQVVDGDLDAERVLRRELPAEGYVAPRAVLEGSRQRHVATDAPGSGWGTSALSRVIEAVRSR